MLRAFLVLLAFASISAQANGRDRLVEAARKQIGVTTGYDGAYRSIPYPDGDVPISTGVCTDVIVRAIGLDLQVLIHEDMKRAPSSYPWNWGSRRPDPNIDHRRVPNITAFLKRQNASLAPTSDSSNYKPGDLVIWELPGGLAHIGVVSSNRTEDRPLIIHNIGHGTCEEDILFAYRITGHYRYPKIEMAARQSSGAAPPLMDGLLCIANVPRATAGEKSLSNATASAVPYDFSIAVGPHPAVAISHERDTLIQGLDTFASHLVRISQHGKQIASFGFRFSEMKSRNLCLWFNPLYETWSLWPLAESKGKCSCARTE